jgi:hypothetical protein
MPTLTVAYYVPYNTISRKYQAATLEEALAKWEQDYKGGNHNFMHGWLKTTRWNGKKVDLSDFAEKAGLS